MGPSAVQQFCSEMSPVGQSQPIWLRPKALFVRAPKSDHSGLGTEGERNARTGRMTSEYPC